MMSFLRVVLSLPVLAALTFGVWVLIAVLIDGWIVVAAALTGLWMLVNAAILTRARQRARNTNRSDAYRQAPE